MGSGRGQAKRIKSTAASSAQDTTQEVKLAKYDDELAGAVEFANKLDTSFEDRMEDIVTNYSNEKFRKVYASIDIDTVNRDYNNHPEMKIISNGEFNENGRYRYEPVDYKNGEPYELLAWGANYHAQSPYKRNITIGLKNDKLYVFDHMDFDVRTMANDDEDNKYLNHGYGSFIEMLEFSKQVPNIDAAIKLANERRDMAIKMSDNLDDLSYSDTDKKRKPFTTSRLNNNLKKAVKEISLGNDVSSKYGEKQLKEIERLEKELEKNKKKLAEDTENEIMKKLNFNKLGVK